MDRENWLLLTIGFGHEKGLTPVQLQKSLFLLGRGFAGQLGEGFYEFTPYNYGPFNADIYRGAETLQQNAQVEIRRTSRWPQYFLTSDGKRKVEEILMVAPPDVSDYLRRVVEWTQSLSFPALVRAIYAKYPEFKANSVFQD